MAFKKTYIKNKAYLFAWRLPGSGYRKNKNTYPQTFDDVLAKD